VPAANVKQSRKNNSTDSSETTNSQTLHQKQKQQERQEPKTYQYQQQNKNKDESEESVGNVSESDLDVMEFESPLIVKILIYLVFFGGIGAFIYDLNQTDSGERQGVDVTTNNSLAGKSEQPVKSTLRNGFHEVNHDNGDYSSGNYIEDLRNGQGEYVWVNGDSYKGEWVDDKRTGVGVLNWADGNRYEGDFLEGRLSGQGTYTWSNGDRYEGQWLDGQRTGKGVLTWINGDRYEGDFLEGQRTGYGTQTSKSGTCKANRINNEIQGYGIWKDDSYEESICYDSYSDYAKENINHHATMKRALKNKYIKINSYKVSQSSDEFKDFLASDDVHDIIEDNIERLEKRDAKRAQYEIVKAERAERVRKWKKGAPRRAREKAQKEQDRLDAIAQRRYDIQKAENEYFYRANPHGFSLRSTPSSESPERPVTRKKKAIKNKEPAKGGCINPPGQPSLCSCVSDPDNRKFCNLNK